MFLYILADLISFLEIQRLQLAGSSSTVFAVYLDLIRQKLSHRYQIRAQTKEILQMYFEFAYSETTIKRTPSGPSQVSALIEGVRLTEDIKIARCLLTIDIRRLLCTVIKLHVLKEAIRVQVHYLSLPTLICW